MTGCFGVTIDEERRFHAALSSGGMTAELVKAVGNNSALGKIMVDALKVRLERADGRLAKPLSEMIAECRFRDVNPDITEERFPLTGEVADVSVMRTVSQQDLGGDDMTTAEIGAAIGRLVYRPATLAELLAYAEAKWNGCDTILALGSSYARPDGYRHYPFIYRFEGRHGLELCWDYPRFRCYRGVLFLVVRI